MTATPIPRTISLKLSEILDISEITELPKGRIPIDTHVVSYNRVSILFDRISEFLASGRQGYIVTNSIDSDDEYSLIKVFETIKEIFKDKNIEMLHGKLKSDKKDELLNNFNEGKIDILVATTVIEVGIDVANANFIVIYNADKFGLSTLHQLRGRVGRGKYKSYCFLLSKNTSPTNKLSILEKSQNGYEIAKYDFELRGGGKILSFIQHGKNLSKINYLNMSKDEINKAFEIFDYTKKNNMVDVNIKEIFKDFDNEQRIVLN